MYTDILAALGPSALSSVDRAGVSLPTEPQALFVYFLLLISFWVMWKGHQSSKTDPSGADDAVDSDASAEEAPGERRPRKKKRKAGKGTRRPSERINWVQ